MTQGTLHRSLTMTCCELLAHSRLSAAAAVFAALLVSNAQQASAQHQLSPGGATPRDGAAPDLQSQPDSAIRPSESGKVDDEDNAKQSKRILWIFPNYRAVSAGTQLPALSLREKFWLATQDSFDYSSFVSAGIIAGVSQANKSYPEFGQGAKGYGRYYWHAMSDQAVGNYLTEAIVPAVTHEDPRYYTLGHGGFFKRTGYAVSRLLITRTTKTVLQPARVPANKSGIKRRRTGAKFWKWDGKKDRPPEALSSFKSDCPLCLTDTHG